MDLSDMPMSELRDELAARKKRDDDAQWAAFRAAYPCPECGGDPVERSSDLVEEYRSAPTDDEGRPMLYMPYEMGSTEGARWEHVLTCANGHVTRTSEIKWFDTPMEGPPLLPNWGAR